LFLCELIAIGILIAHILIDADFIYVNYIREHKMKRITQLFSAISLAIGISGAAQAADIVFLVDESGSMAGEHAWLSNMVTDLELGLTSAGVTSNSYSLIGFGCSSGHTGCDSTQTAHTHVEGVSATDLSTATSGLSTTGGLEDGWEAIDYALNNINFSSEAINFILITDEDRDTAFGAGSLTYAGMETALIDAGVTLNAVVDTSFLTAAGSSLLGVDSESNGYLADGLGGYTTESFAGGSMVDGIYCDGGDGGVPCSEAYVDLALATGGAGWDLSQLRAGGDTATSFTTAFVDIKVEEIVEQTDVPEPGVLALMSLGLLGIGGARRLRKYKA
jgi:hypothetical protein